MKKTKKSIAESDTPSSSKNFRIFFFGLFGARAADAMHFIHNVHKQKVKVVFVKMELEWTPVSCLKSYILAKTLQGVSKKKGYIVNF